MNARFSRVVIASAVLVTASFAVIGCTPSYTMEKVETCGEVLGKESPVEMEVSAVEFFFEGEVREHAVTNYYIATREHGAVKVDFETYATTDLGDPYCTTEMVQVSKANG